MTLIQLATGWLASDVGDASGALVAHRGNEKEEEEEAFNEEESQETTPKTTGSNQELAIKARILPWFARKQEDGGSQLLLPAKVQVRRRTRFAQRSCDGGSSSHLSLSSCSRWRRRRCSSSSSPWKVDAHLWKRGNKKDGASGSGSKLTFGAHTKFSAGQTALAMALAVKKRKSKSKSKRSVVLAKRRGILSPWAGEAAVAQQRKRGRAVAPVLSDAALVVAARTSSSSP